MTNQRVELGDEVRDKITGFKGIAAARSTWLTGCDRISIQPRGLDKDGKPYEMHSFDEGVVEVIEPKKQARVNNTTGGPKPEINKY